MYVAMISGTGRTFADGGAAEAEDERKQVEELARALHAAGHDVRIYTGASAAVPVMPGTDGVPVLRAPRHAEVHGDPVANARAFGSWVLRQWRHGWAPDVVHAHFYTSGLAGMVATNSGGVPLVQTFHGLSNLIAGPAPAGHPGQTRRPLYERLVGARAQAIIAASVAEVDLLASLSIPRASIWLVPDPADEVEQVVDVYQRAIGKAAAMRPSVPARTSVPLVAVERPHA